MTVALKGDLTPGTAVPHPIRVASLLPLSSGGVGSGNGMRDADWRQLFIPGMRHLSLGTCGGVRQQLPLYDHPMSERCQVPTIAEGRDNGSCICFIWSMTPLAIFAG